jgi:hypothetical protein
VKEADSSDATLNAVTLEGLDPATLLSVGLPVIEDDEADPVSAPHQLFGEKDLLALGSAPECQFLALGERSIGVGGDEAYRRAG